MKPATDQMVLWAARLLAILVVGFLSIFAMNVFEEGKSLAEVLTALAIHLIPSLVLLGALILAWRRPWLGAWLFGMAALGYALSAGHGHLDWIAIISGPLLLTAALFLVSWVLTRRQPGPAVS